VHLPESYTHDSIQEEVLPPYAPQCMPQWHTPAMSVPCSIKLPLLACTAHRAVPPPPPSTTRRKALPQCSGTNVTSWISNYLMWGGGALADECTSPERRGEGVDTVMEKQVNPIPRRQCYYMCIGCHHRKAVSDGQPPLLKLPLRGMRPVVNIPASASGIQAAVTSNSRSWTHLQCYFH